MCSRLLLFYIKNRNQTTTHLPSCICPIDYFTSKIEIKPQLCLCMSVITCNYFTSKIEIKPQLW